MGESINEMFKSMIICLQCDAKQLQDMESDYT